MMTDADAKDEKQAQIFGPCPILLCALHPISGAD
jgi:hypothetical protein